MAGQANVYDLTRADEPTQEGTPLNKASLLTDAVASAFGLGTSAVPNDALDILKKAVLAQMTEKYTKHTTIGELPLGNTVMFNFNGVPTEFQLQHKGRPSDIYDVSCDGAWMEAVDVLDKRAWGGTSNLYADSAIHAYLNGDFLSLLDANVRSAIKQVKIPYSAGGTNNWTVPTGENGLSTKAFILSCVELGLWPDAYLNSEGAKLDYFPQGMGNSDTRIARFGTAPTEWWTRSPYTYPNNNSSVWYVTTSGSGSSDIFTSQYGLRPAFILPFDFPYTFYTDAGGNIYTEQEYQTILTDVLGNEISLPQYVESGSYVGTGTFGASNPNTLTFSFAPSFVWILMRENAARLVNDGTNMLLFQGVSTAVGYNNTENIVTWSGTSVSWYGDYSIPHYQMNIAGTQYDWIAVK